VGVDDDGAIVLLAIAAARLDLAQHVVQPALGAAKKKTFSHCEIPASNNDAAQLTR
jgi:hypothetical protein